MKLNPLSLFAVGVGFLIGIIASALVLAITAGATACAVALLVMVLWNYVVPSLLPTVASIDWLTALQSVLLVYAIVIVLRVGKVWTMLWSTVITSRRKPKTGGEPVNFGYRRHFQ